MPDILANNPFDHVRTPLPTAVNSPFNRVPVFSTMGRGPRGEKGEAGKIEYANPIEHDNSRTYEAGLLVVSANGTSYLSKKYVPLGVPLSDTNYWTRFVSPNAQIEEIKRDYLSRRDAIGLASSENPLPMINLRNDFGEIGLQVSDLGNRGLYDPAHMTWLIYKNSDDEVILNGVNTDVVDQHKVLAGPLDEATGKMRFRTLQPSDLPDIPPSAEIQAVDSSVLNIVDLNDAGFELADNATYAVWGNVAMLSIPLIIKNAWSVPADGNIKNSLGQDLTIGTISVGKRPRIVTNGYSSEIYQIQAQLGQDGLLTLDTAESRGEAYTIPAESNIGILRFTYILA